MTDDFLFDVGAVGFDDCSFWCRMLVVLFNRLQGRNTQWDFIGKNFSVDQK